MDNLAIPNAIVQGSLGQIARDGHTSIAEAFVNAECVVIIDCSSSMNANDSRGGRSRYEVACEELALLQENNPGKIAVVCFNDFTNFVPNGVPTAPLGGTKLAEALTFCRPADVEGIRFIVISDGEPNDERRALSAARKYRNRIDVIYVGPETTRWGYEFLQRLAAASGGVFATADRAQELYVTAHKLLSGTA